MEKIYNRIRGFLPVATDEQRTTNNTPKIVTSRFLLLNCFVLVEIWSLSIIIGNSIYCLASAATTVSSNWSSSCHKLQWQFGF